jgi:glycosyltransferase involved in cell wall biosynthesis
MQPKFSIITCTYNSEKYIKNNLKSVKNQNFKNFEHIFIDAFSNDKTVEIIKNYQNNNPKQKIKFFQFPPKGISNAMNKGIEKAKGEYIVHLHSDDSFYQKNVLEKVDKFIKKNKKPDWIYGKANFIKPETGDSRIIPHRKIYHKARLWLLVLTNYIPHQSVFLKKEIFNKYGGFREDFKNAMDYELWVRLVSKNIKAKFIDQIISNFYLREDAQTAIGKNNLFKEHELIYKKYLKNSLIINLLKLKDKINQKRSTL